ncbi:unnamed protein product [Laminaria digitata]
MQEMVANEVNDRMGRAVGELQEKYESGGKGYDAASDAQPTGAAYARAREEQAQRKKAEKEQRRAAGAALREEDAELAAQMKASARLNGEVDSDGDEEDEEEEEDEGDVDSDDEMLAGLDADPEVRRIRESRMREMKRVYEARAENIAKGHGQFRDITQDEFLPEVTSSEKVIVHFYHKDFQRCKVMDLRLSELAPRHLESKFLRIDAEKAPFFVQKLQVKILPTVICFNDGVAVHNIIGFDGLTNGLPEDKLDEWPLSNLARELALAKAIVYSQLDAPEGTGAREHGRSTGPIRAGLNDGELSDEDG